MREHYPWPSCVGATNSALGSRSRGPSFEIGQKWFLLVFFCLFTWPEKSREQGCFFLVTWPEIFFLFFSFFRFTLPFANVFAPISRYFIGAVSQNFLKRRFIECLFIEVVSLNAFSSNTLEISVVQLPFRNCVRRYTVHCKLDEVTTKLF